MALAVALATIHKLVRGSSNYVRRDLQVDKCELRHGPSGGGRKKTGMGQIEYILVSDILKRSRLGVTFSHHM